MASLLDLENFAFHMDEKGIGWLKITVPNECFNVLKRDCIDEMHRVLDAIEKRKTLKGMVIHSGKPDSFIAGADINMLDACADAKSAEALAREGQQLFDRLAALPFHLVVAIHGICLGGGLELALACHSRIGSYDPKTRLGLPEVQLGLLPGSGGTQRLPRLIGLPNALDMMLTGKQVRAKKAFKIGLLDDLASPQQLLDVAARHALTPKPVRRRDWKKWCLTENVMGRKLVNYFAKKKALAKTRDNYPAIERIIEVADFGLREGLKSGLHFEAKQFGQLLMTPESAALRALFFMITASKKHEEGELPALQSVGIVGAGLMGAGIALVSASKANFYVLMRDLDENALLSALNYSYTRLMKKKQRGFLRQPEVNTLMHRISVSKDIHSLKNADMVVEAVFEDLELKKSVLADVEAHCSDSTIFASNTSSLPINEIAKGAKRPKQVIGIHYFSPVEKMPLVEIIPHKTTSQQTINVALSMVKQQGKTPIVVSDTAGFYVNRILVPYMNEAARILLEGEAIEHIDDALLDFGFPLGPFQLLDEVGLDIGAKISPVLLAAWGERFAVPDIFTPMLSGERRGRKSGKGFYLYNRKQKKVDKSVYDVLSITLSPSFSSHQIAMRCVLMMLNEAARCLDEKVIKTAQDGDIGAVFGIGFPPFLAGPFHYMNAIGIERVVALLESHQSLYGERFAPCARLINMAKEQLVFKC